MLFNSYEFLVLFFPIVFILGSILKNTPQRLFLMLASFVFYIVPNPYYIFLLLFSILVDYFAALWLEKYPIGDHRRKYFLAFSLIMNLGFLIYFKYINLLIDILNDTFLSVFTASYSKLQAVNLILPIGISFYTFQSLSYTIDVYRGTIPARKSFIDFALYVSFFPQLVAGPIVRASTFFRDLDHRLPIDSDAIKESIAKIILGFTKKVVFADNLGKIVDLTYSNYNSMNSLEVWVGVAAFTWQIYFDFSGYTDIAIGIARLFGFKFDINFNFPFLVNSIAEHWSRWHISLSTWIKDYIFIPLGGSRVSRWKIHRNIFLTFLFTGVWHGASYHFIAWGMSHFVMLTISREFGMTKLSQYLNEKGGLPYRAITWILTMFCIIWGVPLFRAESLTSAYEIMKLMITFTNHGPPGRFENGNYLIFIALCYISSWVFSRYNLEKMSKNKFAYACFIIANFYMIVCFSVSGAKNFIYYQF